MSLTSFVRTYVASLHLIIDYGAASHAELKKHNFSGASIALDTNIIKGLISR
jgi:hypothetical protein